VELYFKNKFEKLVHLVGFIIRIFHDARSSECHVGRGVEWAILVSFEILPRNFSRATGENSENPRDNWSSGRD